MRSMRSMRPFISKFGPGFQLKHPSSWASPRLRTPSRPTSPPGHHPPEEVSSADGTRGEVAAKVAPPMKTAGIMGRWRWRTSHHLRGRRQWPTPHTAVGEPGSGATVLLRVEQRTKQAREAVGHAQSGRYLPGVSKRLSGRPSYRCGRVSHGWYK